MRSKTMIYETNELNELQPLQFSVVAGNFFSLKIVFKFNPLTRRIHQQQH